MDPSAFMPSVVALAEVKWPSATAGIEPSATQQPSRGRRRGPIGHYLRGMVTVMTLDRLNKFSNAADPARRLLERLEAYMPREALASERPDERQVLLNGRLRVDH